MKVIVRGALRFKHRAGLEKGVVAFDDNAYPEFFKSELWTLTGPFAFCDRSFEIEPDCNYAEAFLSMAREAVEGSIHLREADKKHDFVRVLKLGKPVNRWMKTDGDARYQTFAGDVDKYVTEWSALVEKAKADDAKKAAKEEKKLKKSAGRSIVVTLPANPHAAVLLDDGSIAVAAGTKIVFVAPTGEILSVAECKHEDYDMFGMGITGLCALPDGRVVAVQELGHELRIAKRGDERAERWSPGPGPDGGMRTSTIKTAAPWRDGFVASGTYEVFLVDGSGKTRELHPFGKDDFASGAKAWRGGVLAWSSSTTVAYDDEGRELFRLAGEDPLVLDDGVLVRNDRKMIVLGDDGATKRTFEPGSVAWNHTSAGYEHAWFLLGRDVVLTTSSPATITRWSTDGGEQLWRAMKISPAQPGGLVRAGSAILTFAPPPFIRDKDTTLAVFDETTGAERARLDAKNPICGAVAFREGAAAWLEGRTAGNKILVWRKLEGGAHSETLGGHTGRVRGLKVLQDGRLLSWATDKSLRIWD